MNAAHIGDRANRAFDPGLKQTELRREIVG
jgi:hypothetical protein